MASGHPTDKFSFMYQPDTHKSKNRLSSAMNPVYSPVQPGTPYGNPKNMAFTGYPGGYPATAPTYTPNLYQTGSPGYPPGELIYSSRHPIQSATHSVKWSTPSLHPNPHPIPDSYVPHPQCLPSAEHIRTGSVLYPASVCGSATCDPSHHRGAAQQHPLHSPVPCPRPCTCSSQQRHGCHGNGSWDNHGYECRDPADNAPASPDWSTPSYCANLQAPRDTWVQLCTTSLVEPTHHIWSPPSYATAQILHGLPLVTMGTRHLSARTKLKCNSHFTIIVIVIMRHSLTFLQKLLLFFIFSLFICQPVITLFCMVFILFSQFLLLCLSLELQKDS